MNTPLTVWTHPWNTKGYLPDLTAGECSVVLVCIRSGRILVGSTRSDAMKLLRLRDGPNQLQSGKRGWSAPYLLASAKFPNPYRQFFTGRCGSRAPRGWGWCMGITATAWLAAKDPH